MVSGLEKLILFPEALHYVFTLLTLRQKLFLFCFIIAFGASLYVMLVSPFIFNKYIIPNIEKKTGQKFESHPLINYIWLGKWTCTQAEIATYLVIRYFVYKIKKKGGLPKNGINFGLRKVGYTIEMASGFEITMSFLLLIMFAITVIFTISGLFISGQLSIYYHPDNTNTFTQIKG